MDWISGIQNAINYIEENLTENLDYEEIAKRSYSSVFHFQRVFGLLSGYTLGEYIRNRRLTLAGAELSSGDTKVIDVALKYGYENPDSFARAFLKFHGILPSVAREPGAKLRSFARLNIKISLEGGNTMDYRIENKPEMILTGYKRRFTGVPFGEERSEQEGEMFMTTRAGQWLLFGASKERVGYYCAVDNVGDDGYDFYISAALDEEDRKSIENPAETGVEGLMELFKFEHLTVPAATYAIFRTSLQKRPTAEYMDIRRRIVTEWLPSSGYKFANAPEIAYYRWQPVDENRNRYIEIWMPVEKA